MSWQQAIRPELLALVPVLNLLGLGLKKSEKVDDRTIPLWLGGAGAALAALWALAAPGALASAQSLLTAAFTALVQGVLCAGAAVYANQLAKQQRKPGKKTEAQEAERWAHLSVSSAASPAANRATRCTMQDAEGRCATCARTEAQETEGEQARKAQRRDAWEASRGRPCEGLEEAGEEQQDEGPARTKAAGPRAASLAPTGQFTFSAATHRGASTQRQPAHSDGTWARSARAVANIAQHCPTMPAEGSCLTCDGTQAETAQETQQAQAGEELP